MSGPLTPTSFPTLIAASFAAIISAGILSADEAGAGVVAEVWPMEVPPAASAKRAFEQWRAKVPGQPDQVIALEQLAIPARDSPSMVRVRGVFTPPKSCHYAFLIDGTRETKFAAPDEAEMWLREPSGGGWKLVQRTGNPNKRSGRIALQAGVPVNFEFHTMGSRAVTVSWHSVEQDPVSGEARVNIPLAPVPASVLSLRKSLPDDRDGDGLADSWKRKWALDEDSGEGPQGPWGDPDGDGLLNWQEQVAGSDPRTAETGGRAGLVRWELWRDIPGKYVFDLKRVADFPTSPAEIRYVGSLEIPVGNGDAYGSRLRGWIEAPVAGEYTLMLIADDHAELWLGENEAWHGKRLVARAEGNPQGQWERRAAGGDKPLPAAQTATVVLEAGRKYYVEVLHKQDTGLDHCSVAWVMPGRVVPEVIGAGNLIAWQPAADDLDDDGLPDAWQQAAGLAADGIGARERSSAGDPDRDGLSNWAEMKAGKDPLVKDVPDSIAMLSAESWIGIPGHRVADLAGHPRFPAAPDHSTRVDTMDFSDEGEDYGVRLRGYVTAPEDGLYRFSIAGNNSCTLYLAESEDKFTKRVIAKVDHGTKWRQFWAGPLQQSEPVALEEGKRYYIEVLYKRGADDEGRPAARDHSSVAWELPGKPRSIIGTDLLSPYLPDPRDLDDDDLPDDWERRRGLDPETPSGRDGAWGDPDGDGLENFREFQAGLDPLKADVHGTPGLILQEHWQDAHGKMPGFKADPRFPLVPTRRAWLESLELPQGEAIRHGNRLRALLVPPVSGNYVFSIAGFNGCELLLSPSEEKYGREEIARLDYGCNFRDWDVRDSRMSAPVFLEQGKRYFIEVIHQHHALNRASHLSVGWKIPGGDSFELIGGESLVAFAGDPNDADDDDLPDEWERANGLVVGECDRDGDLDRDGLSNLEEFLAGTRPDVTDTDNDGVDDGMEIRVTGTDPLSPDAAPFIVVGSHAGSAHAGVAGPWKVDGGGLRNSGGRGWVDYRFHLPAAGLHLIEFRTTPWTGAGGPEACELVYSIDGTPIAREELRREGPAGTIHRVLTPWLAAGEHTLRVFLDNAYRYRRVVYEGFTVSSAAGPDNDGNGVPDWVQLKLAGRNSVDPAMTESKVSPACLEGRTGWVAFAAGAEFSPAPNGHWFANVELNPDGSPTPVALSFENRGVASDVEIEWTPTNLMNDRAHTVRLGDSLMLTATAAPGGAALESEKVTVAVDGSILQFEASSPRPFRFEKAGQVVLAVTHEANGVATNFQAFVTVVAPPQAESPVFVPRYERSWTLPATDAAVGLEWDERVTGHGGPQVDPATGSLRYCFVADAPFDLQALFRLGDDGPVLGTVPMRRLTLQDGDETGTLIAAEADGVYRVEMPVVLSAVYPDVTVRYSIFAGGVTFGDGSGPDLDLDAARFGEFGGTLVEFLKLASVPGSVCHRASLWQGSERIANLP
jgi:hypothetical protein